VFAHDSYNEKLVCASPVTIYNAMVTCENKLFQKYFTHCRRPSEIVRFQHVEMCLKLVQNYFRGPLQLTNIFQHLQCQFRNNFKNYFSG